ncbi:MAG TPA: DNA ligase D [Solirubrobacteraceae bacterium]|nr:DNA ligase D [Solirubrobacteraceae bacterium]
MPARRQATGKQKPAASGKQTRGADSKKSQGAGDRKPPAAAGRKPGESAGKKTAPAAKRKARAAAGRKPGESAGKQTAPAAKRKARAAAGRKPGDAGRKTARRATKDKPTAVRKPRSTKAKPTAGRKPRTPQTASALAGYERKRDFAGTPEPSGGAGRGPAAGSGGLPRFVIHQHSARRLHWDLRLEHDGVLVSWAVPKGMPEEPGENRFAAHTEDHPIDYLSFHGEIPQGNYGAGEMTIWDHGTYECLKWEPRKVEVSLHGERLHARYALFAIDKVEPPKDWMIHRMDPPQDTEREPMPERIVPMLARTGKLPADDAGWGFEIKWDGVRAIAYCAPGEVRLESRNLKDITDSYPELGRLDRALGSRHAVLDGEIVAFGEDGRPSFGALQQRMHVAARERARRLAKQTPVTYMIFDLLWLDGHSLMDEPYAERRERLAGLELSAEAWQTPEHVVGHGKQFLEATKEQHLEGLVAKRLDSRYEPGRRTGAWVKIKTFSRQEFVIGGWLPGKGRRTTTIGALLLGVYVPDGTLRHVGRVGSGFTEKELARLQRLLAPLRRESSPFGAGERPPREAVFVEPQLVAEVDFAHWTSAGNIRHPSYKGLREDKPAELVTREDTNGAGADQAPAELRDSGAGTVALLEHRGESATALVGGHELKLSNLGKVLYPQEKVTKGDVISYYAAVAPVLLPHLQGRALTVTRWPDGVEAKSFFQKQSPAHRPEWVQTVTLPAAGKKIDYTLADDLATLVWLANLAAIELHTPLALAEHPDRPTSMVFDLDPGEGTDVLDCARLALDLHGLFENIGLASCVKTSGSKGLQVYVPLNVEDVDFTATKTFAKAVAELFEQSEKDKVVSRMTKTRREGKVLIDWSQNDRNKTTVCVYSMRARSRATIATPLEWDELRSALDGGDPAALAFESAQVLERVAKHGDLFAPVLSLRQRLPAFEPPA